MIINFTQIPDKLKYPPAIRGNLSTLHSAVIEYVSANYQASRRFKVKVLGVLNTLSLVLLSGDSLPNSWSKDDPLQGLDIFDDYTCKEQLGDLYIAEKQVVWDLVESVQEVESSSAEADEVTKPQYTPAPNKPAEPRDQVATPIDASADYIQSNFIGTSQEDLSIQPPMYPQFDFSKPWFSGNMDGSRYVIYTSLPLVPTKQNEISVTTELDKLTAADVMKLFPNQMMQTRRDCMYSSVEGLDYDEDLGIILPITGFTREQVRDNIIRYPHLFNICKLINGEIVPFHKTIEIDGVLLNTADVWESLPDSSVIPDKAPFIKEYVIRRYLLERDICGVKHMYPIFGDLEPFLTLLATPSWYTNNGYPDSEGLARQCVKARVNFKRNRNPILRRFSDA